MRTAGFHVFLNIILHLLIELKVNNTAILKSLKKSSERLDRMRAVLEDLDVTMGSESTRSAALVMRPSVQARIKHNRS